MWWAEVDTSMFQWLSRLGDPELHADLVVVYRYGQTVQLMSAVYTQASYPQGGYQHFTDVRLAYHDVPMKLVLGGMLIVSGVFGIDFGSASGDFS